MATKSLDVTGFDYRALNSDDRQFVKTRENGIREAAKRTAENIVLIGQWLTEVKECLPHGSWLPWLKTEFGWSERSARNFMEVHAAFKSANFADLTIDVSALYLIAAPKTPEPVRQEVIRRAQSGERISHATVNELIESYERTQTVPTPAVARQIAQATGLATLSTDREYVLPMSKAEQDRLADEQLRVRNLYSAIELIVEANMTPDQMVSLGRRYFCRDLGPMAQRAAVWLNAVARKEAEQ